MLAERRAGSGGLCHARRPATLPGRGTAARGVWHLTRSGLGDGCGEPKSPKEHLGRREERWRRRAPGAGRVTREDGRPAGEDGRPAGELGCRRALWDRSLVGRAPESRAGLSPSWPSSARRSLSLSPGFQKAPRNLLLYICIC